MQNFPGDANSYPTNIRAASGSDLRNATTEAATASDLADRTAWLAARASAATIANGAWFSIPMSAAITFAFGGTEWDWVTVDSSTTPEPGLQTDTSANTSAVHYFVIPLSGFLPKAGYLRGFSIDLQATQSHGSNMPANMPSAQLYNTKLNSPWTLTQFVGPTAEIQCVDNTELSVTYMARHQLGINYLSGGQYTLIDLSVYQNLFLKVNSEYGTNALNGLLFLNPQVWVSPTTWTQQ